VTPLPYFSRVCSIVHPVHQWFFVVFVCATPGLPKRPGTQPTNPIATKTTPRPNNPQKYFPPRGGRFGPFPLFYCGVMSFSLQCASLRGTPFHVLSPFTLLRVSVIGKGGAGKLFFHSPEPNLHPGSPFHGPPMWLMPPSNATPFRPLLV